MVFWLKTVHWIDFREKLLKRGLKIDFKSGLHMLRMDVKVIVWYEVSGMLANILYEDARNIWHEQINALL